MVVRFMILLCAKMDATERIRGEGMKIYLTCFVAGIFSKNDVIGYALCEDGHVLVSHSSSDEDYSKHDMGLTSDWHHDTYSKHCPEGFELIWIDDADHDENWLKAIELNNQLPDASK